MRRLRRVAVLQAAVLACVGSVVAAGADAKNQGCPRAPTGLIASTAEVRVWSTKGRLYGCAIGHDRRLLVAVDGSYPPLVASDVLPSYLTKPPVVDVSGMRVAYAFIDGDGAAGAVVQDLSRPVREMEADGAVYPDVTSVSASGLDVAISQVKIGPGGRLAAVLCSASAGGRALGSGCTRAGEVTAVLISQPGDGGALATVAQSNQISPQSLQVGGTQLTWLQAGRRRSASFLDPRPLRPSCATAADTVRRTGRVRILRRAAPGLPARYAPVEVCRLPDGPVVPLLGGLNASLAPGRPISGGWVASLGDGFAFCLSRDLSRKSVAVATATGRQRATWDLGADLDALDVRFRRVLVEDDGLSALVATVGPQSCSSQEAASTSVVGVLDGRTGQRTILGQGVIDPGSLGLHDRTVTWTQDGAARSAVIAR